MAIRTSSFQTAIGQFRVLSNELRRISIVGDAELLLQFETFWELEVKNSDMIHDVALPIAKEITRRPGAAKRLYLEMDSFVALQKSISHKGLATSFEFTGEILRSSSSTGAGLGTFGDWLRR